MPGNTFVFLGSSFALVIDECFSYKQAASLKDHSFGSWFRFFWDHWFRFFGPMHYLTIDQEGALAGYEGGSLCDKLGICRVISGSDSAKGVRSARHTRTGLAEQHVRLTKSTMLKLHHDAKAQGIECDLEQAAAETTAAHNALLTFRGVSPNVGVLGIAPRELYELDNTSCDAAPFDTGLAEAASQAIAIRHPARAATLQTVAEHRLAMAHRTRPQQTYLS